MNNILTYDRLKISCPYPLQYITQLEISSRLNEHSRILVTGVLREEEQDQCIRTATAQDAIQVYETGAGTANGKDALIFAGIVTHLSVNVAAGVYTIEIEGLSYTHLLDIEVKSRSFQDENAGYAAVIAQILSDYDDASFIQIPDDRPTGGLLVQYQETDWEFIRRLATHFNTLLIPQDLGTGPRFWLGVRQNTKDIALEHEANVRVKTDEDGYYKASAQGFNVRRAYFVKYGLESGTRLILGERLTFQGKPCIVERADASFSKGLFRYQYLLGQEGSLLQAKRHNPQLQGVSLLGSVLDTRDSAVQLHLRLDAEQKNDPACWLPYAPPSNNLFYCMPETGENASLYFPTADEKSAIVINSVRRNGGSCSKTSKPDTKYLSIPSGQEIKLSKKDVAFSHNEGVSITLDAAQGILVHSREDLTILSQRSLTLEAKEKIKMSANTGDIIIGSGANASLSQLLLMSGVNGDTHIYAANKLLEDGRYRERFPDRLNQAIVYKEKAEEKFSWLQLAACVVAAVAVVALVVVTAGAAAVVLG
ncbi:MAG: phage late control D family protein, partial [Peptococcaceae bacterium]|nr:phage late control D family protein [Peptococcaceae bacterium]